METTTENNYAGFWARTAAYFIDGAIIAFLVLHCEWLTREQLSDYFELHPEIVKIFKNFIPQGTEDFESKYTVLSGFMYYYLTFISFIMGWMYFAGMESSPLRGTIGKWALGIYVTDTDGNRISFAQGTGRYFAKIISGIILCVGYMMAGFTERKQALHDMMASCLVCRK